MISICKRLHTAKDDEAEGIIEYVKLKNLMPSDHEEHINTIDDIITDEHKHLVEILEIIKEMNCVDPTVIDEICMIGKTIYEKANKIEKLSDHIDGEDGKRLKEVAETIEKMTKEIKTILKNRSLETMREMGIVKG